MGEPVDNGEPTLLARDFAEVHWSAGNERREAAIEGAAQVATFVVRSTERTRGVRSTDIIRFDEDDWDISGPPVRHKRRDLEFTATRRA